MWSQKTSSNNPRIHEGAWGCIGGHRQTNNALWLKKDNPKGHLWPLDQYCAASVTRKHHMSVSNSKRYAVQPACCWIKAVGLYIRSIPVTAALTGLCSVLAYLLKHPTCHTVHMTGWITWRALNIFTFEMRHVDCCRIHIYNDYLTKKLL